jgi:hypothetical protein
VLGASHTAHHTGAFGVVLDSHPVRQPADEAKHASIRKAAWYRKSRPTFADALALVRKELWAQEEQTFCGLPSATETVKVLRAFVERLTDAVCYAA